VGLLDRFRGRDDGLDPDATSQDRPAPPPDAGLPGLRFPLARGRGYRRDDVDLFLVRVATMSASEIHDTHFRTERRGYAMDRVDAVLDSLETQARERDAEAGSA
jgi:DivIVA domain-containing protein